LLPIVPSVKFLDSSRYASFICGSGGRRSRAAIRRDTWQMRILLIPLFFAFAVVVTLAVLATPPKADGTIGSVLGQRVSR
jgi:hypothetical protein